MRPYIKRLDYSLTNAVDLKMNELWEHGTVLPSYSGISVEYTQVFSRPQRYPLPEVIVILNDEDSISEVKSLESYILEELNVRKVTITSDKLKYGVSLHAEPDHKTLGARLKSAFKPVTAAIKQLSDEQLQDMQKTGKLEVLGHTLELSDLRIMFSFTGHAASELAQRYEPHSDNDVLVLLDVTPDEEMQQEGIAREVINRVQKLRKKAHLVPSDTITVYYSISPADCSLAKITQNYKNFIETTIKASLIDESVNSNNISSDKIIIQETQQLKGASLSITISGNVKKESPIKTEIHPHCRFVKVCLECKEPGFSTSGTSGFILLENPVGENILTLHQLHDEVKVLFELQNMSIVLCDASGFLLDEKSLANLHSQTIYVRPKNEVVNNKAVTLHKNSNSSVCKFINVEFKSKRATLLTENPEGVPFKLSNGELQNRLRAIFQTDSDTLIDL